MVGSYVKEWAGRYMTASKEILLGWEYGYVRNDEHKIYKDTDIGSASCTKDYPVRLDEEGVHLV